MQHFCGWFTNQASQGQYAYLSFPMTHRHKLNLKGQQPVTFGEHHNIPCQSGKANESFLCSLLQKPNTLIRKTKISDYQDLLLQYGKQTCKWTDPNFPPNDKSFGKATGQVCWRRVSDLFPGYTILNQHLSDELVGYGGITSALRVLAEDSYRTKDLISMENSWQHGIYMVRIMDQGVYKEIVVDDFVPCNKNGETLFCQPTKMKQLWPLILQKVWAKVCGSYITTQESLNSEVLQAFIAAPTTCLASDQERTQEKWDKLIEANRTGYLMCAQTKRETFVNKAGLLSGCSYTILSVYDKPFRIVKLRNPYLETQSSCRACNKDIAFWNLLPLHTKQQIGYNQQKSIFFMLWEDLSAFFSTFSICEVNENASYFNEDIIFSKKRGQYFQFFTQGSTNSTTFTLSQNNLLKLPFDKENKGLARTTLIVAKYQKAHMGYEYKYIASKSTRELSNNNLNVGILQQGIYIIFAKCDWTRQQPDLATVSVYSEGKCRFKKITLAKSQRFLYKTFLDHARKNQRKQILRSAPLEWICSDFLLNTCGYGYLAIHLDEGSNRNLGIELNEKEYNEKRLVLKKPYKGQGKIKNIVQPGKELIVLFRMKALNFPSQLTLPTPKIYNLV